MKIKNTVNVVTWALFRIAFKSVHKEMVRNMRALEICSYFKNLKNK